MMVITTTQQTAYIRAAVNAVAPWNSADAMVMARTRVAEPQEVIERCLNCTCSECCNCIAYKPRTRKRGVQ